MKVPFVIYADSECLLENISSCHNDHTPSGYSLTTHRSFGNTKNMLSCYRVDNCIENFCETLKKHAERIIYRKKKRNDTFNRRRK